MVRRQRREATFRGEELYVLAHCHSLSAWRFHLTSSISHKWVERQGSDFYINSKSWNSFRGGECGICWEKSQNLEVAKLGLTHGGLGRF